MKLSPEYLMTDLDEWMILLLDDCCMNNGYVYDCAGLLSFEILLVYCMLYIIFLYFRPFMAAGDKGKQNQKVRVHVLVDPGTVAAPVHDHAPMTEPKKLVIHRDRSFEWIASSKMITARKRMSTPEDCILIPQTAKTAWGESSVITKTALIEAITGTKPKMGMGHDADCMRSYLNHGSGSGLQDCEVGSWTDFIPNGAPVLDFLVRDIRLGSGWNYPDKLNLERYQRDRGLYWRMLEEVKVVEIVVGISSDEDILSAQKWMLNEFNKDQNVFPSGVVSMDVEEAKISRFDELIMLGKAQCGSGVKMAERKLAEQDDRLPALSFERDRWRRIPVRLMVGNGITWVLQIVLDCDVKNGRYEIKKQNCVRVCA